MMKSKKLSPLAALLMVALMSSSFLEVAAQRRRAPQRKPGAVKRETPSPSPAASHAETAGETDRPVEELLSVEHYGLYLEVRNVGRLLMSGEVKEAIGALALIEPEAGKAMELVNFAAANEGMLGGARMVAATFPTRAELPLNLLAVQLPSPDHARLFEPKLRAFLNDQAKGNVMIASNVPTAHARGVGRAGKVKSDAVAAPSVVLRRAGSWLLWGEKSFTLRALRGNGRNLLANSRRYQNMRSRFASESIFVYLDVERVQKGWGMQMQAIQDEMQTAERESKASGARKPDDETNSTSAVESDVAEVEPAAQGVAPGPPVSQTSPNEDSVVTVKGPDAIEAGEGSVSPEEAQPPPPPTEEQLAMDRLSGLLFMGLYGGVTRMPGAVAAAGSFEGGSLVVKVAVENTPGVVNLIPFLPNIISGPPVTAETRAVAPADADVFIAGSLDWQCTFDATLSTAKEMEKRIEADMVTSSGAAPAGVEDEEQASIDATIVTIEKLFGFKFKGELLPALGSEIAFSAPFDYFDPPRFNPSEEEEKRESKPGPVVILSLNNPDAARRILPRLFAVMGFGAAVAPAPTEKREGFEIGSVGSLSYAFIDDFLLFGSDIRHVRHAVESYAHGRTLAFTENYREATGWQPPQRLLHVYVADALMRSIIRDARKMASGSTDPVVLAALAQLDIQPEASALATVNEGDLLLHELRLPVGLFRVFAVAGIIGTKEAPFISNEGMALFALQSIHAAQVSFRSDEENGRYATLEELRGAGSLEEHFLKHEEYKIEIIALGDRFEATATPVNYGKTGRRSFFIDQTGIARAADHKGRPATAQDPPVQD